MESIEPLGNVTLETFKAFPTNQFYLTFGVYDKVVFYILFYLVAITLIVACIYCNAYFIKKFISLFKKK